MCLGTYLKENSIMSDFQILLIAILIMLFMIWLDS